MFRLSGAQTHHPAVDAFLDGQTPKLGAIARRWFTALRDCGDGDIRELMHDGYATACLGDAALAYVGVFRAHVNLGFFFGAELPDPAGLLQGRGRQMRHVKLRPEEPEDVAAIEALIAAAYAHLRSCLQPVGPA